MVAEVWGDRLGEAGAVGPVMAFVVTSSSNHWVENVDCFADSGITKNNQVNKNMSQIQ